MRREKISKAVSQINDDFVSEANEPVIKHKFNVVRYLPIAASFLVVALITVSLFTGGEKRGEEEYTDPPATKESIPTGDYSEPESVIPSFVAGSTDTDNIFDGVESEVTPQGTVSPTPYVTNDN